MRRDARTLAFKLIFETFFNSDSDDQEFLSELKDKDKDFCFQIFSSYKDNSEKIQQLVKPYLKSFNIERVYKVDLAIIYEAVAEIEYINTPPAVAVNEALEIAKVYSTANSPKFINGVLSSYIKDKGM